MADQHASGPPPPHQPPHQPHGGPMQGRQSGALPQNIAAAPMRVANPIPGASGASQPTADDLLDAVGDGVNMALEAVRDVARDAIAGGRDLMDDLLGPASQGAAPQPAQQHQRLQQPMAPTSHSSPPQAPQLQQAPQLPRRPAQMPIHSQQPPSYRQPPHQAQFVTPHAQLGIFAWLSVIVAILVLAIATPLLLIVALFALGFPPLFVPAALFALADGAAILGLWAFFVERRADAQAQPSGTMPSFDPASAANAAQPVMPPQTVFAPPPTPQMAPADFEEHEPSDPSDPFPHEATLALADRQGWMMVGASRRGWSHAHDAKYREDGLAGEIVNGWRLAAVADGGGAYALARVGANLAVKEAVAGMRGVAQQQRADKLTTEQQEQALRNILLAGLTQAHQAVFAEAQSRNAQPGILRTTLLLLAICDHRTQRGQTPATLMGAAQIGDGAIVARGASGQLLELGVPDTGQVGNETLFFQDVKPEDWPQRIRVTLVAGPDCHCLAMTDGVSDDFNPLDVNLERLEKPLFTSTLAGKPPEAAAKALLDLLAYKRSGSFDDRTLVCIYRSR